jgi:putative FmdB family regulatory protein
MPLYDYVCGLCGPFEARADVALAGAPAGCPACGAPATRAFGAPGGRGPRRQRRLEGLRPGAAARVERAESGVPSGGAMPAGARIDRSGRPHVHSPVGAAGSRRPWQLGH